MNILPLKKGNITVFKGSPSQKIANDIANIFMSYRRPFKAESVQVSDMKYLHNRIASQLVPFIQKGEKIPVVLVGFSMKSPSPLKTISQNADRAEFETLKHLNNIAQQISKIYPTGSDFRIYTDGRIFVGSIVGSSDNAVTKYVETLRTMLKKLGSNIKLITPEDYYQGNPNQIRKQLFSDFFVDRQKMEQEITKDPFLCQYKTCMRDFYAKDIRAIMPSKSIRQSRKEGAEVAMNVICAAESLDRYIKSVFHDKMFRISVHAKPVYDLYNKVGIYMNEMKQNFPMPWHAAAARLPKKELTQESFIYEKKHLLENAGSKLIPDADGKGAYYELPKNFQYKPNLSFKENLMLNKFK